MEKSVISPFFSTRGYSHIRQVNISIIFLNRAIAFIPKNSPNVNGLDKEDNWLYRVNHKYESRNIRVGLAS